MSSLVDLPPQRPLPPARARARQALLEQYASTPVRMPRRRRIARYLAVTAAGSTLLFGGAAAAYVAYRPASVPVEDQTRCYTVASLDGGDSDFHGTTVGRAWSGDGQRSAAAAVELCAALWQQGVLEAGAKGVRPPEGGAKEVGPSAGVVPTVPVPPLQACVLDNGIAAVFPGDTGTCARLGLAKLAG
ncbi:hypothetical protein AB0J90_06495 [Micromonospora sp. NPDC049523]|uniref:hypothetical protein n=1 Tax=Micromonospora sp. NPDC049523 TaxID=3155921 RepID=UPI00343FEF6D